MTAVRLGAHSRQPVVLVSKDLAVRIKAEALGVAAQDYRNDKTTIFQRCGRLLPEGAPCEVRSVAYRRDGDQLLRLRGGREPETVRRRRSVLGISAKNVEQECALDALVTPDIDVVALTGKAGTGKTLLALAAGIDQTAEFRAGARAPGSARVRAGDGRPADRAARAGPRLPPGAGRGEARPVDAAGARQPRRHRRHPARPAEGRARRRRRATRARTTSSSRGS